FAQDVLCVLQSFSPSPMMFRKEIFDDVAKALDSDSQAVQRVRGLMAHGFSMQSVGFRPAFQRQVLINHASQLQPRGLRRKMGDPALPLLAIKLGESLSGIRFCALVALR